MTAELRIWCNLSGAFCNIQTFLERLKNFLFFFRTKSESPITIKDLLGKDGQLSLGLVSEQQIWLSLRKSKETIFAPEKSNKIKREMY